MVFFKAKIIFKELLNAINKDTSDKIPDARRELNLLLIDCFINKRSDDFAHIVARLIELAILIYKKKNYYQLSILFNLDAKGTINLIKIIAKKQFTVLSAIVFNRLDLKKLSQDAEMDSGCIIKFRKEAEFYLEIFSETYKNSRIIIDQEINEYLLNENLLCQNLNLGRDELIYFFDLLCFTTEKLLYDNRPHELARIFNKILIKINFSKLHDFFITTDASKNDYFYSDKILFSSRKSFIKEQAVNNNFPFDYIKKFIQISRLNIIQNDYTDNVLLETNLNVNNLLIMINQNIKNIINNIASNIDLQKEILKSKDLFDKYIEYCLYSIVELNPDKFINLLKIAANFVIKSKSDCYFVDFLSNFLFSSNLESVSKQRFYKIIYTDNLAIKDNLLMWQLLNSKIIDLPKVAKGHNIDFIKYQQFNLVIKKELLIPQLTAIQFNLNTEKFHEIIDFYSLLYYVYHINDIKTYIEIINLITEQIVILYAQHQISVIINLLRLTNNQEILNLLTSLDYNKKEVVYHSIIEITLNKINNYYVTQDNNVYQDNISYLWHNSEAISDYYINFINFKSELYKLCFANHYKDFLKINTKYLGYPDQNFNGYVINNTMFPQSSNAQQNNLDSSLLKYKMQMMFLYQSLNGGKCNFSSKLVAVDQLLTYRLELLKNIAKVNLTFDCAKLILIDLLYLKTFEKIHKQIFLYIIFQIPYNKFVFVDNLIRKNQEQLLKLFLLQNINFSKVVSFRSLFKSNLDFKRKIFDDLGLNDHFPIFSDFNFTPLINGDNFNEILNINNNLKLLAGYILYSASNNKNKKLYIKKIQQNIKNLYVDSNAWYSANISMFMDEGLLLKNNIPREFICVKIYFNYIVSLATIKDEQLCLTDLVNIKDEFNVLNYFSSETIKVTIKNLVNFTKINNQTKIKANSLMLRMMVEDALQDLNSNKFSEIIIEFFKNFKEIIDNISCHIRATQVGDRQVESLQPEMSNLIFLKNFIDEIFNYNYKLLYKSIDVGITKLEFFLFLSEVREMLYEKHTSLVQSSGYILIQPNLFDYKDNFAELKYRLISAWFKKDHYSFCNNIEMLTDLIILIYKKHQTEQILKNMDFLNSKKIFMLFRHLEARNKNAIRRWLVNHYLDSDFLNNIFYSKTYNNNEMEYDVVSQEQFKKLCYKQLKIQAYDLLNIDLNLINNINFNQDKITSLISLIRFLANKRVKISKYEQLITLIAKNYNIAEKQEFVPNNTDLEGYHEIHAIMQAIWKSYITGHLFSIVNKAIIINRFALKWEGSYGNIILEYLRKASLNILQEKNYIDSELSIESELIEALINGILSNKAKNSFWLNNRLALGKLIAMNINLYDGGESGHQVGAVFWKDLVILGDRSVNLEEFSGIKLFKIIKQENVRAIIEKLTISNFHYYESLDFNQKMISSIEYKQLQNKLKLQEIYSIPMPIQLTGNCAFSSSAESIHLGLIFLCYLKLILNKKPYLSFQDACGVAEEYAITRHNNIINKVYEKTIEDLITFFNKNSNLYLPRKLLAEIYMINLYKIKNPRITSLIKINLDESDAVYKDYIDYFRIIIDDIVSCSRHNQRIRYHDKNSIKFQHNKLINYSKFCTEQFLIENKEHEDLTKVFSCINSSILYGDKKIGSLMFKEFDRPILNMANVTELEDELQDHSIDDIILSNPELQLSKKLKLRIT